MTMRPRDLALALLTTVFWGLNFVVIPYGLESFSAAQLTALRFIVAALPVLVLPRPRIGWGMLVLIGLTLFTGQFLLLFLAYRYGLPAGLASVTQQMQVVFTLGLAATFLGDRPGRQQVAGLVIACAGLGLIGLTTGADLKPLALVLALSGACSWSVGNILLKRLGPIPIQPLVAWLSLVPPLPSVLLGWLFEPAAPSLPAALMHATWASLLAVLYLGIAATSVSYGIWSSLLARYPASQVAPISLLVPCTGILAAMLVLGERFSNLRLGGMALIGLGLAVIVWPRRPRQPLAHAKAPPDR